MKIGRYELHALDTGRFALDGGAMFGVVPRALWEKTNPADGRNRIDMATRVLLLIGEGRKIIVDTGIGTKLSEKQRDIYRVDLTRFSMTNSLAALGLTAADITDVILTHLHFDHAGGAVERLNGELRPAFPGAKYYVQKRHWEWALKPTEKDRASFMNDDFLPLREHSVLTLIDGPGEIFTGVELVVVNGHTEAQQLVKVADGSRTLLYCCDLIPMASHVPLPYIMGYDIRPLVTLEEKKRTLARALDEGWLLFIEHDPAAEIITVKRTEKGYAIKERLELSHLAGEARISARGSA